MSRTGFAGKPATDVLPTCSIDRIDTLERISSSVFLTWANSSFQAEFCGKRVTFISKRTSTGCGMTVEVIGSVVGISCDEIEASKSRRVQLEVSSLAEVGCCTILGLIDCKASICLPNGLRMFHASRSIP